MTVIIEVCQQCHKEFMPLGSARGDADSFCIECRASAAKKSEAKQPSSTAKQNPSTE